MIEIKAEIENVLLDCFVDGEIDGSIKDKKLMIEDWHQFDCDKNIKELEEKVIDSLSYPKIAEHYYRLSKEYDNEE